MTTRTRQLVNGKWIAEVKTWLGWRGIQSWGNECKLHRAGTDGFRYCPVETEERAQYEVINYRAFKGESK